jgi:5-methylcytosine-specific restriction endonuclease McrA
VVVPLVTASASTVAGDGKESSILESQGDVERGTGDSEKSPSATISSSEGPAAVQLERWALVHFRTREVVIKKLERVRSIASHRLPGNAPLDQVVEFLADRFLEREDPAERHARREERKNRRQRMPEARSEEGSPHIPKRVRDHVFARDKGQCTYVSPNGKRCGSTRVLQVDHIHPIARGGPNTPDNLRLLCAYHNRLEAERLMGRGGPFQRPSRGPGSFRL